LFLMVWICVLHLTLSVLPVWCILVDGLGISFRKCCFCYIYLLVHGALIYFVLCFVCGRLLLFVCLERV
jgi:hypothetical protein